MTTPIQLAEIHKHDPNHRGEIARALLASDARVKVLEEALRRIEAACKELDSPDCQHSPGWVAGYVEEIARAALEPSGEGK